MLLESIPGKQVKESPRDPILAGVTHASDAVSWAYWRVLHVYVYLLASGRHEADVVLMVQNPEGTMLPLAATSTRLETKLKQPS